ncbi:MAG: C69 family dipeptidase [Kiritimatiellae bacterium]|nr:C69 family dipeptidase [Kiritimatiellia bacterium]
MNNKYLIVLLLTLTASINALQACTAVVVGKKASATGSVIVGHNTDLGGRFVMRYSLVPARVHEKGALMVQEPDAAKIPELERSYSFYWAEVKSYTEKYSPGDHMLNEHGVTLISNNGGVVKEWLGVKYSLKEEGRASELVEGGLKHNFRRAVIERAKSAREAINIATNLIETWGYAMPSRIFTIADKDEAWVLQVVKGRRYIARRCPDDAVVVYPNSLTIGKIEKGDIVAPHLLNKPEDFHFIREYQGPRTWRSDYNCYRWRSAYEIAAGIKFGEVEEYPFSTVPARKVSWEDVKNALSCHRENKSQCDDIIHPFDGQSNTVSVCRRNTKQSMVCVFAPRPEDIVVNVAPGRPCSTKFQRCRPFAGQLPKGAATGKEAYQRLLDHIKPLKEF